jgi:hypothetical protein
MASRDMLKTAYRILTWTTFAGLALTLFLVLRKSPAPAIPTDSGAAARVEQKFAAADQQKSAGQSPQVALDSTELNSYLSQNLQVEGSSQTAAPATAGSTVAAPASNGAAAPSGGLTPLPEADGATLEQVQSSVKDVKVDMDGDLVKAYVTFDFHGKDLSLELDGHLGTQNGYVKFEPVAGKLGSLPLPQAALDSAVQKMMASPENREKLKLPDDISDIQIQNGQAVVSYK